MTQYYARTDVSYSGGDKLFAITFPYIKREHIYFIEGKDDFVKNVMLTINQGGIHCACTEVPEGVTINDKCSKG